MFLCCSAVARAQMQGMDMSAPAHGMDMATPSTLIETILQHTTSGTSIEPPSTPKPMLMRRADGWELMLHGSAFIADIQQDAASDRGGDKLFSTNWIMPMAQRQFGAGELTLRTMLSLEPATITGRYLSGAVSAGRDRFWPRHR